MLWPMELCWRACSSKMNFQSRGWWYCITEQALGSTNRDTERVVFPFKYKLRSYSHIRRTDFCRIWMANRMIISGTAMYFLKKPSTPLFLMALPKLREEKCCTSLYTGLVCKLIKHARMVFENTLLSIKILRKKKKNASARQIVFC